MAYSSSNVPLQTPSAIRRRVHQYSASESLPLAVETVSLELATSKGRQTSTQWIGRRPVVERETWTLATLEQHLQKNCICTEIILGKIA